MEKYVRAWQATDDTVWRILISRWIPKATNTHSQYVIFIAFPLQIWIHESASMLRYTYIAFLFPTEYRLLFFIKLHEVDRHESYHTAQPTSRCILFDGENISFETGLVIYINSTNIPPIVIINRIY